MRKYAKIISLSLVLVMLCMLISGCGRNNNDKNTGNGTTTNETEGMSDTMLANVEALANEEWYDGNCFWIDWNFTWCKEYGLVPLGCPCGAIGLDL